MVSDPFLDGNCRASPSPGNEKGITMSTKTQTQAPARRVSDIAPSMGELTRMEALQEQDLTLLDAIPQTTQFGEGFLLKVVDAKGMPHNVLTSAVVVCRQIGDLIASGEPLEGLVVRFVKQGRCWVIQ